MTVHSRVFQSSTASWEEMCDEAASFATSVGQQRLINISVAASGGADLVNVGAKGLIIVWYWA